MNIIGGAPPPRDKRGRIIPIPNSENNYRTNEDLGNSRIQVPEGETFCFNPGFQKKAWIVFSIFVTITFISCIVIYFVIFHDSSEIGNFKKKYYSIYSK